MNEIYRISFQMGGHNFQFHFSEKKDAEGFANSVIDIVEKQDITLEVQADVLPLYTAETMKAEWKRIISSMNKN